MAKKFNMKLFNKKFNVTYKHVEITLIIITMLISVVVIYMVSKNINSERENLKVEKFQSDKKLLLFYAPWCGASKSFLPTWERLESEFDTEKYDVDLDENKQLANEYNIEFLPTVYLVNNGQATKYDGDRTYEDLVKFFNN
jgi:thioredoxin 1